jgi:hypothetical protein
MVILTLREGKKMEYKKININKMLSILILATVCILYTSVNLIAQNGGELKWLRVGSLHHFFSEQGAEVETPRIGGSTHPVEDGLFWPADYGDRQSSIAARGMWVGTDNYNDPVMQTNYQYKVVGVGPISVSDQLTQVIPAELKLIGCFDHPMVIVDGAIATDNQLNDALDGIDENMFADRMIINKVHTAIGLTITRKCMAFTQQYNDNYFIYDYCIKNTGIIDKNGTVVPKKLTNCWFMLDYRYSLGGESVTGYNQGWGLWNATWGNNIINDVVGYNPKAPGFDFRASYSWYGPYSTRTVDDWGCPDDQETGIMAAARFVGNVTLHADSSTTNRQDNIYQPKSTWYIGSDTQWSRNSSQYDPILMTNRYNFMKSGDPAKTHAEEVGSGYADLWGSPHDPGGYAQTASYGPYNFEIGDSIHIIVAEGVAGLSREKNREVGGNWFQWYKGLSKPPLVLPDGKTTEDFNAYKKAWVLTCRDSLTKTYRNAIANYATLYDGIKGNEIPLPPPPPASFTVEGGGDRIRLSWADNADSYPNFDGYQIYRSEGSVMSPKTVYEPVFSCSKKDNNVVHTWDDKTPKRGFDYYYYIQSKDNGSTNIYKPGVPLVSSKFYTMTNSPATLQRPAGRIFQEVRVVPNPYDIRARKLAFEVHDTQYDRMAVYEIPPQCKLRIYTERGDLIWEKDHTSGTGDQLWDSLTEFDQIVASGIYILYVEVTKDIFAEEDVVARRDYVDPKTNELIYKQNDLLVKKGDLWYKKGESVYRKFVVIR